MPYVQTLIYSYADISHAVCYLTLLALTHFYVFSFVGC